MITFYEVRVRPDCVHQTVRVAGRPFAKAAVTLVRSDQMNDEIRNSEFLIVTPPPEPEPVPAAEPEMDLSTDNAPAAEDVDAAEPEMEGALPAEDTPVKRGKKKGGA